MASDTTVLLGHGSGGQMMKRLIDEVFLEEFGNPALCAGNDAGVAPLAGLGADSTDAGANADAPRIALSTDSFVVTPQFFPGGNIRAAGRVRHRERRGHLGRCGCATSPAGSS